MVKKIKSFIDLEVYRLTNLLAFNIHQETENFPREEKFRIIDQVLRVSYSVGANIAEGFGRYHKKEFIKFLYNSRGSLMEVKHFLIISEKLGYLDRHKYKKLEQDINILGIKINNLISAMSKLQNNYK